MKAENRELYGRAIAAWGDTAQTLMLMEELAELQKEICHMYRGRASEKQVVKELADVSIMVEQTVVMLNISDKRFKDARGRALNRLRSMVAFSENLKRLEGQTFEEAALVAEFGYKDGTKLEDTILPDYILRTAPGTYIVLGRHIDDLGEEELANIGVPE